MNQHLDSLLGLFFPDLCPACGKAKPSGAVLCTHCLYDIPLTGFTSRPDNAVFDLFWGEVPVAQACSLMWYMHESPYRHMIHALKYRGSWQLARDLGVWLGSEMEQGGLYGDVDIIVPVPLHPLRLLSRGYNQAEYMARGLSESLCRPAVPNAVIRKRHTRQQAKRTKEERWENVEGIFAVRKPKKLAGKHILLVDDVLTTGATIASCAGAITKAAPDCRISVATLAVSKSLVQTYRRKGKAL